MTVGQTMDGQVDVWGGENIGRDCLALSVTVDAVPSRWMASPRVEQGLSLHRAASAKPRR